MHFYITYYTLEVHQSRAICTLRKHGLESVRNAKRATNTAMIRCHLSRLMGEKRVRISDVARVTGISRNMLAKLYYDRARRVDLGDVTLLCKYFACTVGDLFEWSPTTPGRHAQSETTRSSTRSKKR